MDDEPEIKGCARRVRQGDRIMVYPPEGHGMVWAGGAGRKDESNTALAVNSDPSPGGLT